MHCSDDSGRRCLYCDGVLLPQQDLQLQTFKFTNFNGPIQGKVFPEWQQFTSIGHNLVQHSHYIQMIYEHCNLIPQSLVVNIYYLELKL